MATSDDIVTQNSSYIQDLTNAVVSDQTDLAADPTDSTKLLTLQVAMTTLNTFIEQISAIIASRKDLCSFICQKM
jgi:hypothetical protein